MAWRIEDRYKPLYLFKTSGPATDERLVEWVDQVDKLTRKLTVENAVAVVIVVMDTTLPDSAERARIAKAHERLNREQLKVFIGTFVVVPNALFRGAMTALGWLMPGMMNNVRPVASYNHAIDGALQLLRERGLPEPDGLERLRAELGQVSQPQAQS